MTSVTLLGTPLLILLWIFTLAAPFIVVALWGRLRGPRLVRLMGRTVLLIGAQIVAVALVAACINDYALFYKSWSELGSGAAQLAGANTHAAASETHWTSGPGSGVGGRIDAKPYASFSSPNQWASKGRLESVTIHGATSGLSSHGFVYLPPQYFRHGAGAHSFPAIEVFTGYPGIDQYLVSRLKYPDVMRRLIDQHRATPAVLVMIRPSVTFPRDTECTDVPGGPLAETFFGIDVPAAISSAYRVFPTGWGAIGDSTGGYCATKLAMLNPGTFNAAAEMSGYFFALRDRTTGDLWGGSSVVRNLNDLSWRLKHLPTPPIQVLEGTSPAERGPDGYDEAVRFARLVHAPMKVSLVTVPNGGHNIATWASELPTALSWLSARLPHDCPGPVPVTTIRDLGMSASHPTPRNGA